MKLNTRLKRALPLILALHALLCWRLALPVWSSPMLLVEMSSTVASEAQVYFDRGAGFNEADSAKVPVASGASQQLRLPLPHGLIRTLRFDPVSSPGEVVIYRAEVLRPDGSVAVTFTPTSIHETQQVDRREVLPNGVRLHVSPPNTDPQLRLDLASPLDLRSRFPGLRTLLHLALGNALLLIAEVLFLFGLPLLRFLLPWPKALAILIAHLLLTALLLHLWSVPPMVEVEMSSSVTSRAQVYWDMGAGMSEEQSSSQPVRAGTKPQLLQFPLPYGILKTLRFDPITSPGMIVIHRSAVVRADGSTALAIEPSRIRGVIGFDQMELEPSGLRFRIRADSLDPQMAIDLDAPIDLQSHYPGNAVLARVSLSNAGLLLIEALLLVWPPGLSFSMSVFRSMDSAAAAIAGRFSSERFIVFDRLAIWFYIASAGVFLVMTLANLNGSSMGIFWSNFKVGAPPHLIAGIPQEIRADEFNFQTPDILNQYFRARPFALAETATGSRSVGLLAEVPVRHVTTLARPQYWPFFTLPADYAFAAWWQAKGLIMVTGVFTLLLLLTQSSRLALVGSLWLFFSQFTQWCYSWPSMLPEMAGLLCFTVVFALYLTVGANRVVLLLCAIAAAACAINFALCAYVPHLVPYAWTGILLFAAWCAGHRADILQRDRLIWRAGAFVVCIALTTAMLLVIFDDTRSAVAGIAATIYPGHRVIAGGGITLSFLATHFLAASENAKHFPPEYSNISESAGFLWLAPVTLLCFSRMRALTGAGRIILASLWLAAILFLGWMVLPVPASVGHLLFFDRVQGVRFLPALGLLNVCIVMLVLSAPDQPRRLGIDAKLIVAVPVMFIALFIANQNVHQYFKLTELLVGAIWTSALIVLLVDGRRPAFAALVVIPNLLLFGLINPVQHGIHTITHTPLFDLVQRNKSLREGKWLVFSKGFPSAIFTAVGCDVYNTMRYLPDLDHFPLLAAHAIDTGVMNNLGYLAADELEPGQPPSAKLGPYGPILSISPLDPLVKELGIRYVAFHDRPAQNVLDHLKPLISGSVSEFWIYELQ